MRIEAAAQLVDDDPAAAKAILAELRADASQTIADIRRLVEDLRPPQLDDLGLVGAIRDQATRLASERGELEIAVVAPDKVPPLPAAVEVAAYRIAQEALLNVVKHSAAGICSVEIDLNGGLSLAIADDGLGVPDAPHGGVGLASMRERAAELGGSCTVKCANGGGTIVTARLPTGHAGPPAA
jgi:signal transduction histidine kinase